MADLTDTICLRDSKHPAGPVPRIDRGAWQTFVAGVRGEHFRRQRPSSRGPGRARPPGPSPLRAGAQQKRRLDVRPDGRANMKV
jgi:Domain of unknown function (DUF397)